MHGRRARDLRTYGRHASRGTYTPHASCGHTSHIWPVCPQERSGGEGRSRGSYNRLVGAVIAVANQKGGVAKTTTVHTLAAALVERDRRVLIVDLDPQACLTYENGLDPDELDVTVTNGVVTFVGEIGTRNEARLLAELATRLDGVLHVESNLVWRLDDGDE